MSSRVICRRPRGEAAGIRVRPIDPHEFFHQEVREAAAAYGGPLEDWFDTEPTDCHWDDLLAEASGFGPPKPGTRFEASLRQLAEQCDEVVIWYPSDDFLKIPVVDDEREFSARVNEMVARGDIEPKLRFVRRPQTR